ncbi:MAG TPA: hypothetical protein VFC02_18660 [Anaerolineales bacterium]|nr:hypothetical protein [Anaerolineales bacterium]
MSKKNGTDSLMQSEAAKLNNLAQWRGNRIHEHDLPSGLHVKIRDVTMTDLMLTGKLPAVIVDIAMETAKNGAQEIDLKAIAKSAEEFSQMLNTLIEICLVEPRIGSVADDEHITLAELPGDDKMEIFNFINREAQAVRSFREG